MLRSRVALLVVDSPSQLTELWRVAVSLDEGGRYTPIVHFTLYAGMDAAVRACEERGIAHEAPPTPSGQPARPAKMPARIASSLRRRLARRLAATPLGTPFLALPWALHLRRLRSACGAVLQQTRASIIVLAEDNVGEQSAAWVAAGHDLGVPSVVVPYTVAKASEAAASYYLRAEHSLRRWDNRLLARWKPQWSFSYRGRRLTRLPAYQAWALECSGMAPPEPWVLHSGFSDAIAVESARMMKHYVGEGLPPERLRLVGSLADDELRRDRERSAETRALLAAEHGLDPSGRLLVCAVPPSQFGALPAEIEFDDYPSLLRAWTAALADLGGWDIVLRLHPRMADDEEIRPFLGDLPVSTMDTLRLIAACDVYVASVSATIRWAIASGVPVVNYDVYRFGYDDYDDVSAVLTVDTLPDFRASLGRLTADDVWRAEFAAAQRQESHRWGLSDGCCGDRLVDLFDSVIEEPKVG